MQPIVGRQFHAIAGTDDWRVLGNGAGTCFVTKTFADGLELVRNIAAIAEELGHHPDIDLRYSAVFVRVWTYQLGRLTDLDAHLAVEISAIARRMGIRADPSKAQSVQLAIDAMDISAVRPFWAAVLGYDDDGDADLFDPLWRSANIWFQQMDVPRPQRNRIHVDVYVGRDEAPKRVAAGLAAGGHLVSDSGAPDWWTLADAEGNEVDVAAWPDDLDPDREWD